MRRLPTNMLAIVLATAVAVALSSCGSGGGADLLPGTTASQINSNLDEVRRLVEEGDCSGATDEAAKVSTQVDELGGVDPKLKKALGEGAERLTQVVSTCFEESGEETETTEAEEPELEEVEKDAKAKKPEKSKPPKNTGPPEEPPEPPGQEEKEGSGEGPSEEEESSGGVGPGSPVEGG